MLDVEASVLALLERVTGTGEVRQNLDLDLFEEALLDSLALVELIAGLAEELKIVIAPSEIERGQWRTPRKIVAFVALRAEQLAAAV